MRMWQTLLQKQHVDHPGLSDVMAAPAGAAAPPPLLGSVVRVDKGFQAVLPSPGSQLVIGVFASRQLATVALDLLRLGSGLSTGLDAAKVPLEYGAEVSGSTREDASNLAGADLAGSHDDER